MKNKSTEGCETVEMRWITLKLVSHWKQRYFSVKVCWSFCEEKCFGVKTWHISFLIFPWKEKPSMNQGSPAWQQLPAQQSLDPCKMCVQKIYLVWRVKQNLFVQLSFLCAYLLSCNSKGVNGFCLHVILHTYPSPAEQSVTAAPYFCL